MAETTAAPDTKTQTAAGLTAEQVEVFASGLYHLANSDGITDHETQLIREFLDEAGVGHLATALSKLPFDPDQAARVLDATWLRRLFIKTAILLMKADKKITSEEYAALDWMAGYLGLQDEIFEIEKEIEAAGLDRA